MFSPGKTPHSNILFLTFLSCVIQAVDRHAALLRASTAKAGNDHRLGAQEAPPAIISIFLGDDLTNIIEQIKHGGAKSSCSKTMMELGVDILPELPKDTTDRNRTSPFAFTGNKFEFRSLGSAQSISAPNVVLNTAIADTLEKMADELEGAEDFTTAVDALIRRTLSKHMRIIFNGNGYDDAWKQEAARRGLSNLPTTVDALPHYLDESNIALFERQKVYTREEMHSRYEIHMENYVKVVDIEALSMLDMARHLIIPAAIAFSGKVAGAVRNLLEVCPEVQPTVERRLLTSLHQQLEALQSGIDDLETALDKANACSDLLSRAQLTRDDVISAMVRIRAAGDALEVLVGKQDWPMPTYQDLLNGV